MIYKIKNSKYMVNLYIVDFVHCKFVNCNYGSKYTALNRYNSKLF